MGTEVLPQLHYLSRGGKDRGAKNSCAHAHRDLLDQTAVLLAGNDDHHVGSLTARLSRSALHYMPVLTRWSSFLLTLASTSAIEIAMGTRLSHTQSSAGCLALIRSTRCQGAKP